MKAGTTQPGLSEGLRVQDEAVRTHLPDSALGEDVTEIAASIGGQTRMEWPTWPWIGLCVGQTKRGRAGRELGGT